LRESPDIFSGLLWTGREKRRASDFPTGFEARFVARE